MSQLYVSEHKPVFTQAAIKLCFWNHLLFNIKADMLSRLQALKACSSQEQSDQEIMAAGFLPDLLCNQSTGFLCTCSARTRGQHRHLAARFLIPN